MENIHISYVLEIFPIQNSDQTVNPFNFLPLAFYMNMEFRGFFFLMSYFYLIYILNSVKRIKIFTNIIKFHYLSSIYYYLCHDKHK